MKKKSVRPATNHPLVNAAFDCGGTLLLYNMKIPAGQNGGCGAPINVAGTNGGKMPCGSMLTMFGKTAPYFCGSCQNSLDNVKQMV